MSATRYGLGLLLFCLAILSGPIIDRFDLDSSGKLALIIALQLAFFFLFWPVVRSKKDKETP